MQVERIVGKVRLAQRFCPCHGFARRCRGRDGDAATALRAQVEFEASTDEDDLIDGRLQRGAFIRCGSKRELLRPYDGNGAT